VRQCGEGAVLTVGGRRVKPVDGRAVGQTMPHGVQRVGSRTTCCVIGSSQHKDSHISKMGVDGYCTTLQQYPDTNARCWGWSVCSRIHPYSLSRAHPHVAAFVLVPMRDARRGGGVVGTIADEEGVGCTCWP
jgi:hypothetical protein